MAFEFPVPQYLRQQGAMGCGVPVFGELIATSREEILRDRPNAEEKGLTVEEWEKYLRTKGYVVRRYLPGESYPRPCAHLVFTGGGYHWVYQSARGVFDPDPSFESYGANDSRMLDLSVYPARILTLAVTPSRDVVQT